MNGKVFLSLLCMNLATSQVYAQQSLQQNVRQSAQQSAQQIVQQNTQQVLRLEAIQLRQYKLSFTGNSSYSPFIFSTGDNQPGKADSLRYKSHIHIEGGLQVKAIQVAKEHSFAQWVFTPTILQIKDEGLSQDPDRAAVARLLSMPVYILHNDSGRVVKVYFQSELPTTYRQLWNQLIGYSQFINKEQSAGGQAYNTNKATSTNNSNKVYVPVIDKQERAIYQELTEEDRIGFFRVQYEMLPSPVSSVGAGALQRFRKRGIGYSSFSGKEMAEYGQSLDALYALRNGQPESVALNEKLELTVKGKNKATSTANFSLSLDTTISVKTVSETKNATKTKTASEAKATPESKAALALLYDSTQLYEGNLSLAAVTLSNYITRHEMRTALYKQTLGSFTLSEVLRAIDTLTVEQAKTDKDRLNRKVAALIYLNEAPLDSFMLRIERDTALSPAFLVIVKGLSQAGTPPAQEKIALLLQRFHNKPEVVDFFINTLLFLEKPTSSLISSIQQIAFTSTAFDAPVPEALRYLLGSFSHSLKKNQAELGISTLLQTMQVIQSTSHKGDKEKVMEMLGIAGNAGTDTSMGFIKQCVSNADIDIRQQALFALRLLDTNAADELLMQEFVKDTSAVTRLTILTVFRYRPFTTKMMNAVADMLTAVQDETVAVSGVRLLYENKKAFPQAVDLLHHIATTTKSASAKKEIRTLLTSK